MKVLDYKVGKGVGFDLHTLQFEIPASKRTISFDARQIEDININRMDYYQFYLSLPKIRILTSFVKTERKNELPSVDFYIQYGFFFEGDKNYPILLPNISTCYLIDSCSNKGSIAFQLQKEQSEVEYAEIIGRKFFETAFAFGSGSVCSRLVRIIHDENLIYKNLKGYSDPYLYVILDFYRKWQTKTKTIQNYNFLEDNIDLIEKVKLSELKGMPIMGYFENHAENLSRFILNYVDNIGLRKGKFNSTFEIVKKECDFILSKLQLE